MFLYMRNDLELGVSFFGPPRSPNACANKHRGWKQVWWCRCEWFTSVSSIDVHARAICIRCGLSAAGSCQLARRWWCHICCSPMNTCLVNPFIGISLEQLCATMFVVTGKVVDRTPNWGALDPEGRHWSMHRSTLEVFLSNTAYLGMSKPGT